MIDTLLLEHFRESRKNGIQQLQIVNDVEDKIMEYNKEREKQMLNLCFEFDDSVPTLNNISENFILSDSSLYYGPIFNRTPDFDISDFFNNIRSIGIKTLYYQQEIIPKISKEEEIEINNYLKSFNC